MQDQDIIIAGGGIAGMIATLIFAQQGFATTCVDPAPPVTTDLRSTAFLNPSVQLLDEAGIFAPLKPHAAPLRVMRLVDAGGVDCEIREQVDFIAEEIGAEAFGWNIPNAQLREILARQIDAHPNATITHGLAVTGLTTRLDGAIARFSDGSREKCKFLIAADGRDSQLRVTAGIKAHRKGYGQKAVVFSVTHTLPHECISTEIHRTGGPFTLVPLAGADQHRSAVVWMETGPEVSRLMEIPEAAFNRALNIRSCGILGDLKLDSDRAAWPIISQHCDRLYGDRMALIAEAAHVVPPIGAQGLNMSLGDIAVLKDLIAKQPAEIGTPTQLQTYSRRRMADIRMRVAGIDALNRAAMAKPQLFRDLRVSGLKMIGQGGLRHGFMKLGLGAS